MAVEEDQGVDWDLDQAMVKVGDMVREADTAERVLVVMERAVAVVAAVVRAKVVVMVQGMGLVMDTGLGPGQAEGEQKEEVMGAEEEVVAGRAGDMLVGADLAMALDRAMVQVVPVVEDMEAAVAVAAAAEEGVDLGVLDLAMVQVEDPDMGVALEGSTER